MCGTSINHSGKSCLACGEKLPLLSQVHSDPVTKRLNWSNSVQDYQAAILMFLIGFGVLLWLAWKCFVVLIFGGSFAELWSLLAAAVLLFLAGWDFLPGTKRNADPVSANPPAPSESI